MSEKIKQITDKKFLSYINKLCSNLSIYLNSNNMKVDYICPILRSGAVPAVYIANRLNIVKFAPIQVKHVKHNDGSSNTELIFSPFKSINIEKKSPTFLIVEGIQESGKSVKMCIDEINKHYKDAKIMCVSIAKKYNSLNFDKDLIYEDTALICNSYECFDRKKCKKLNIQYEIPIFPWETRKTEIEHLDDLESNIYF